MATEWYLLKSPYSQLSGFESDAYNDFAQEGFLEALESDLAFDVDYCSPDLSECTTIRAFILKRTQDTKLNAFTRHLLVPVGTCKAGWYIKYKNRYWLIVGLVDDNGMYEKAVLKLCNWKMEWLNEKGNVIERWANIESASQYNNGQREIKFYTIRTDQLLICMPDDEECLLLDSGQRFIIDKRVTVYEKDIDEKETKNTSFKVITYQLTRNDSVLYNYIDSGHYEILVTQDEQHDGDGFYRIGNKPHWICLEKEHEHTIRQIEQENTPTEYARCIIDHDSDVIYNGLGAGEFTAVFYDKDGNTIDGEAEWTINCAFEDKLQVDYINNTICISVDDNTLLNKSFELLLNDDENTKLTIKIVALI